MYRLSERITLLANPERIMMCVAFVNIDSQLGEFVR